MKVPLSGLQEGQEGVVIRVEAPIRPIYAPEDRRPRGWNFPFFRRRFRWRWRRHMIYGAVKRLADLGIVAGTRIRVVRKAPFNGPIEVEVAGSRFLIGRGLADKIVVEV